MVTYLGLLTLLKCFCMICEFSTTKNKRDCRCTSELGCYYVISILIFYAISGYMVRSSSASRSMCLFVLRLLLIIQSFPNLLYAYMRACFTSCRISHDAFVPPLQLKVLFLGSILFL